MSARRLTLASILLIITLLIIVFTPVKKETSNKIIVAATIPPEKEFIEKIAGDKVQVIVMVPKGADPHTYEPNPETLEKLKNAKVYFEIGSGIEFEKKWMENIKSINPHILIVNCSEGIKLLPSSEGTDPHVWNSPKNAIKIVENIYTTLSKIDPSNKNYYERNKDRYVSELKKLDNEFSETLSHRKNKYILVYHPAWGYLCHDYGLKQIAIEKEGKEPNPETIKEIINEAKRYQIKTIFITPLTNKENSKVIAKEIGAKIIVIDPLAENYVENMYKVLEALKHE